MPLNESKIYSLIDLISLLKVKDNNKHYFETLKKIQFGFKEIEHLCFWDRDNYSKISIENGQHYELVLICWEKGQQSQVHNHDINEAWTFILKGELTEEVFKEKSENPSLESTSILSQKDISSIKKETNKVHRLTNSSNGRTVSLHLYKK